MLKSRLGFLILFLSLFLSQPLQAKEGMWLPYLLGQLNADEMSRMGLQITPDDIYSVNQSSLKDAIVHFGGGCTAELISSQGLLLTNHHCGYSNIQSHSSVENDYLKDGYWAMNRSEELKNPKLTAAIVKYMEDVTNAVLAGVSSETSDQERDKIIAENIEKIITERKDGFDHEVKAFFYGNQYILIAKETFKDVRLVGAPPSSIGKFGADTDNWVWPRHTGDFSLFRIYAGSDNKPAEISDDNRPYQPKKHLQVNLQGFSEGDFTMVYGFPGTTSEYLPSNEVSNIIEVYDPARIAVRDKILAILDKKMRESDATRIQYASKYARISNAWKKWIGEIMGLEQTNAVAKKEAFEKEFEENLAARPEWASKYGQLLPDLMALYEARKPVTLERYLYLETNYYGNEMTRHLLGYREMMEYYENDSSEALASAARVKAESLSEFYKDYDATLDQKAITAVLPSYLEAVNTAPVPEKIAELKRAGTEERERFIAKMYGKNPVIKDQDDWLEMLRENPEKAMKKLRKSEAWQYTMAAWNHFLQTLNPAVRDYQAQIDELQRDYLEAMQNMFPKKRIYPDANSSLRLSYGQVHGYAPRDGVEYESQTYLSGVMEKYVPGDYEFDVPEKLIALYQEKDYGQYGENGKMPVCFIGSNHTTGGNSGSPALNARGHLIGLNFDRTWEGTMSDYNYDISLCRNIMVDIRYVLFIIDKFAGAGYLVDEMSLVTDANYKEQKLAEPAENMEPALTE